MSINNSTFFPFLNICFPATLEFCDLSSPLSVFQIFNGNISRDLIGLDLHWIQSCPNPIQLFKT
uniref:Uncharacterized protein n=1 Tax=Nelumbo nucifera TaxID=4432 RepID=A0A822ZCX0_NELNU|nr:TPA_asm: hypothetical protein HUJ06_000590 [Nelumbo nucifera]